MKNKRYKYEFFFFCFSSNNGNWSNISNIPVIIKVVEERSLSMIFYHCKLIIEKT